MEYFKSFPTFDHNNNTKMLTRFFRLLFEMNKDIDFREIQTLERLRPNWQKQLVHIVFFVLSWFHNISYDSIWYCTKYW